MMRARAICAHAVAFSRGAQRRISVVVAAVRGAGRREANAGMRWRNAAVVRACLRVSIYICAH